MLRVMALVVLILLGFTLLYLGLQWLWRTASGEKNEVDGEKMLPATWQNRLPATVVTLFVLLGVLLMLDRIFNSHDQGVRHYVPATLEQDGQITSGRRY